MISEMNHEMLNWMVFPFSLSGLAKNLVQTLCG
jgi:hypothetical protein